MISTKFTIREQNETTILNEIINAEETSRASLSQKTGLNKASVSSITKKLLDEELITESRIGAASTLGGRKPIMLQFNGKSALVVALDIGYNYIKGMLANIDGTILSSIAKTRRKITAENVVAEIAKIVDLFIQQQPTTKHGIVGMTAAIHGVVYKNEIRFTPYYDLDTMNLYEEVSKRYPFPFHLHNEANLAAIGEYTFTSQYENLVMLSIHSGIGAGIVNKGKIQLGKEGAAGEIGHSIFLPNGRKCPCGNHGCIEQYASNSVVYKEMMKKQNISYANSDIVLTYHNQNDSDTKALLQNNSEIISIAINDIIMHYNPDIIVINSSLYRKIPEMIDLLKKQLNSHYTNTTIIRNTLLEDKAILFGCLALSTQHFLNIRHLKLNLQDSK